MSGYPREASSTTAMASKAVVGGTATTRYSAGCVVVCQLCNASECNKRMWYQLDNHDSHFCERCLRDHARSLRR